MITIFVHLDSKEEISSNLNFGCGNPLDGHLISRVMLVTVLTVRCALTRR